MMFLFAQLYDFHSRLIRTLKNLGRFTFHYTNSWAWTLQSWCKNGGWSRGGSLLCCWYDQVLEILNCREESYAFAPSFILVERAWQT